MKFLKVLMIGLMIPYMSFSQTAPNINITDVEGNTYDLYELLDSDKYVFIDFFSYWCGICCSKAPTVKQIFESFGCNTGDLIVLAIDNAGSPSQVLDFEDNCAGGPSSPVISGNEGNGLAAYNAFGLSGQPHFRLISPDRSYISYSSSTMTLPNVSAALQSFGINASSCFDEPVGVNDFIFADIKMYPSIVTDYVNFEIQLEQATNLFIDLFDLQGKKVHQFEYDAQAGFNKLEVSLMGITEGNYFLQVTDRINKSSVQKIYIQ